MGSEEERRCESMFKPIPIATDVVRCVLWADHSWRAPHRGFDANGMSVHWEGKDAWQPVEDRRLGDERARIEELEGELARWKARNRELNRDVGQLSASRKEAQLERDEARREARAVRDQMTAEDRERLQVWQQLREARQDRADAFNQMEELKQSVAELTRANLSIAHERDEVRQARDAALLDASSELEARKRQVENQADLIRTLRDEVHMHRSRAEA